jgi:hypothetical protein
MVSQQAPSILMYNRTLQLTNCRLPCVKYAWPSFAPHDVIYHEADLTFVDSSPVNTGRIILEVCGGMGVAIEEKALTSEGLL